MNKLIKDLNPRGVTCSRSGTYDAEVVCNGVHYVVKQGIKDRAEAQKLANGEAAKMRRRLVEVVSDYVTASTRNWPRAQP